MTSKELKRWQIEQLQKAVGWCLRYLGHLTRRMDRAGFVPTDRLYVLANQAYNAVFSLNCELHTLECEAMKRESDAKGIDAYPWRKKPPAAD